MVLLKYFSPDVPDCSCKQASCAEPKAPHIHKRSKLRGGPRVRFALGSRGLIQAARPREQTQHDRKQLALRGDAEPLIGALAVGQGRMQADAKSLRDRLGAEACEDAAADLLLTRRQRGEWGAGGEQRGQGLVRPRRLLEMARHAGADRGRNCLKPRTLCISEAALGRDAVEIDVEAG